MRNFAIVGIQVLMTFLAFEPAALAQNAARQARPEKPGLEVPLITPGPGWRPCPRCENAAYVAEGRRNANVDSRTFDRHDISGIWSGTPEDVELNGTPLGDGKTLPAFTPYGEKLFESTISESTEWSTKDPMNVCDPQGFPRNNTYSYGVEFITLPDRLIQFFEVGHVWRTIWTDGRKLPADPPIPRFYGYAVGRWEGDTFVVESNGYDDRTWLGGNNNGPNFTFSDSFNALHNPQRQQAGLPHSDEMQIEERYRRVNYGLLELTMTITDPKVYTAPWTSGPKLITMIPNTELGEHLCVPSDQIDFNNRNIAPALRNK